MNQLLPAQITQFMKRFHFQRGTLRRFRVGNRTPKESSGEIIVAVHEGDGSRRVRLRIVLDGVEEYRFQRRPGPGLVRLKEVRLGVFNGMFYLNLDAYADDVPPAIHDFRASDAFVAARSFAWEIIEPKLPTVP
jgi:hypothetical protein